MSYHEKINLAVLITLVLVMVGYAGHLVPQMLSTPAAEIAYKWPMIWASVGSMVVMVAGIIAVSAVEAAMTHFSDKSLSDKDIEEMMSTEDERDKSIDMLGEYRGGQFVSLVVFIALILIWVEVDMFWIANMLFVGGWVGALIASSVKMAAYRGVA